MFKCTAKIKYMRKTEDHWLHVSSNHINRKNRGKFCKIGFRFFGEVLLLAAVFFCWFCIIFHLQNWYLTNYCEILIYSGFSSNWRPLTKFCICQIIEYIVYSVGKSNTVWLTIFNPTYLTIFLHGFTSGWGKTPHWWKMNYLMLLL